MIGIKYYLSQSVKCLLGILIILSCQDLKQKEISTNAIDKQENQKYKDLKSLIELFDIKDIEVNTDGIIMDEIIFGGYGTGDIDGSIYLIGYNQEIYKIDSCGNLVKRLFRVGNGPGEYLEVGGIVTDEKKNLYIDDHKHGRILVFDSTFNYVNYIPRQASSSSAFASLSILGGNILVGLSTLDTDYGLYKYNTSTYELIEKCCSPDERALKFSSWINAGKIDTEGDQLFFIKPHYYQIFKDEDCSELEIIKRKSQSFVEIEKKVKTVYVRKFDYSILKGFYCEKQFFIVKYSFKSEGHKNYDLIDRNGNIIKENIPLNFNYNEYDVLIKYSPKNYFTFSYKEDDTGEPKLIIHLLKLKRQYW